MKAYRYMLFTVLAVFGWTCWTLVAQTTNGVPVTPVAPLPSNLAEYWELGISALSPIIVWLVAKYVPLVPKQLLPVITPVVGILLGLGVNALANADLGWVDMAKAGALAVFIREVINQNITKRMVETTATTTPPAK